MFNINLIKLILTYKYHWFSEKATAKLAGKLENFKFNSDDYDFNTDFTIT